MMANYISNCQTSSVGEPIYRENKLFLSKTNTFSTEAESFSRLPHSYGLATRNGFAVSCVFATSTEFATIDACGKHTMIWQAIEPIGFRTLW